MGKQFRKLANKHIKTAIYTVVKSLITKFKPTLLALVFLLVSGYIQNLVPGLGPNNCADRSIGLTSVIASTFYQAGKSLQIGHRKIDISIHAAERMLQRQVSRKQIRSAVRYGQIFAYQHSDKIKIGYYHDLAKLFVAVDQRHRRILTVIGGVPIKYIQRLIDGR